jgi:formylglycine-generating enzyme
MKRLSVKKGLFLPAFAGLAIAMSSCGGGVTGGGDLVGVPDREAWGQTVPFGMVVCPSGTFHMGQADENIAHTQANLNRQITIGGFYMDDTEITNNEYRQYVTAILEDSLDVWGEEFVYNNVYPDTSDLMIIL